MDIRNLAKVSKPSEHCVDEPVVAIEAAPPELGLRVLALKPKLTC